MIPVLFKKNEQQYRTYGLGEITDIIKPKVTRERNGQYQLYFQYPQDAELSDIFEEDMRIKSDAGVRTKWQTFEISRVVRQEGQLIEVFAKHISQSLLKDALNPAVNVRTSSAEQALRIWNNNRIGDETFDVWSDITTTNSTRWDIRDVSNAFEALAGVQGSILDVWGGEYEFDNKMIRLHREMGRKAPVPLEYGRNITNVEQDIQDDNVYTSVYPFAVYTPEDADEPKTVTISERYVDGKYLDMHNKRKIQVVDFSGEFEYDDVPTGSQLRTLTNQYLESNEVGLPHENLKVEYIDLAKTLDYQDFQTMEEIELNDRLPIFYPKFGVTNENAKAVVVNYDPVKEENISIELGAVGQSFRNITTGGIGSRLDRVEQHQNETDIYIVNSRGNRIWYTPPPEDREHDIGDTWFEENGQYTRIRIWNGDQWIIEIDTEDVDKVAKEVERQQEEISETKEQADHAVEQIDVAVENAGFTTLDETISSVQSITNAAQASADVARDHALDALSGANTAMTDARSALNGIDQLESTVADINIDIDEINGTLSLKADSDTVNVLDGTVSSLSTEVGVIAGELSAKADSSVVDTLSGIVDNHGLDIQANAEGLALKANQDTVDTLAGTVQSLGTEFDVVAGQVSSRVWNTDIETAIDGIEVGGRNLLLDSHFENSTGGWISYNSPLSRDNGILRIDANGYNTQATRFQMNRRFLETGRYTLSVKVKSSVPLSFSGFVNATHAAKQFAASEDWKIISTTFEISDVSDNTIIRLYMADGSMGEWVEMDWSKLEKGTKATDWSPAPEDTDAKFEYIESEFTQTFESFEQEVSSIDGRVTSQEQRIDSVTTTIQEVQSDIEGNTKLINQTKSTVDTHTQTIATIETDLDGKATVTQYNTIKNTIDSTIQRIGDAEGNITQIEANIDGLQSTVADKASQTEVTQLSNLYSVVVSDLTDLETDTEAQFSVMSEQINLRVTSNQLDTAISDSLSTAEAYADATAQTAQEAAQEYAETKAAAERELAEIYASGLISAEQQERITAIENNLSEAQSYAETKASEAKTASDAYTDAVAEGKVDIGKVVSQINIETDNILIESGKLYLDAESTVFGGDAFIPSAAITALSADKITSGTFDAAKARIINLDFDTAVGNRTEFVQSAWNSNGSDVRITGGGIVSTASDGSQGLIQNGVFLARRPESGSTVGYIGYDQSNGPSFQVTTTLGAHFKVRNHLGNEVYKDLFTLETGGTTARFNVDQVLNNSGKFRAYEFEGRYGGRFYSTSGYQTRLYGANNNLYFLVGTNDWAGRAFRMNTTRNFSYKPLNMDGNEILSSPSISDERLKNVHGIRTDNDLEKLMQIEYVNFKWKNEEYGGEDLGFVSQQVQSIVPEMMMENKDGFLGYNQQTYLNFVGHAVQQLVLREENTNKVASQALVNSETNAEKIERLEKEIQKLKEAA